MKKKGTVSMFDITQKITSIHEMISTSYHEAGHAVYALLCGVKVPSIVISQNKTDNVVEGFCYYEIPYFPNVKDDNIILGLINYEIGIKYAGLAAEKHFFKNISGSDKFPIFLRDGSSDDTLSAAAIIRQYNVVPPGKKRYQFKKRIIREVLNVLKIHWEDVTLLSHFLFAKKKVSFYDIKDLFIKKSQNKKFWRKQFKNIQHIAENNLSIDEKNIKYILGL